MLLLAVGCELHLGDDCIPFYYYVESNESVWDHPYHKKYVQIVKDERKRLKREKKERNNQGDPYDNDRNNDNQDDRHRGYERNNSQDDRRSIDKEDNNRGRSREDDRDYRNKKNEKDSPTKSKRRDVDRYDDNRLEEPEITEIEDYNDEANDGTNNNNNDNNWESSKRGNNKGGTSKNKNKTSGNFVPKSKMNSSAKESPFGMSAADFLIDEDVVNDAVDDRSNDEFSTTLTNKSKRNDYDQREDQNKATFNSFGRERNQDVDEDRGSSNNNNKINQSNSNNYYRDKWPRASPNNDDDNEGLLFPQAGNKAKKQQQSEETKTNSTYDWGALQERGGSTQSERRTTESKPWAPKLAVNEWEKETADPVGMRIDTSDGYPKSGGRNEWLSSGGDTERDRRSFSPIKDGRFIPAQLSSAVAAKSPVPASIERGPIDMMRPIDGIGIGVGVGVETNHQSNATIKALEAQLDEARYQLTRCEERLQKEKDERVAIEVKVGREREEWEAKLKESSQRIRNELEAEWMDRERKTKLRLEAELEESRSQVTALRRQVDEAVRDADAARRRVASGRDEGKAEAMIALESIQQELAAAEDKYRAQTNELKKVREEQIGMAARLATALQASQIAAAEAEAAKSEAAVALSEKHTNFSAIMQATQKMQLLDTECSKLRAENLLLRQECDTKAAELRKLQGTVSNTGDKLGSSEHEKRRLQAQSQVKAGSVCFIVS